MRDLKQWGLPGSPLKYLVRDDALIRHDEIVEKLKKKLAKAEDLPKEIDDRLDKITKEIVDLAVDIKISRGTYDRNVRLLNIVLKIMEEI